MYLKTRVIEDVLLLTDEERQELWVEILPRLAKALSRAFQPDRLNYSHLANVEHFVHWHIVPRYEKNPIREFAGETFIDERVEKHYAPAPTRNTSAEVMDKIYKKIKEGF